LNKTRDSTALYAVDISHRGKFCPTSGK